MHKTSFFYWVLQIILLCTIGCSFDSYCYDVYPYGPWLEENKRAEVRSWSHMDFYWQETPGTLETQIKKSKKSYENLEIITLKIENYAKENGFWYQPKQLSPVIDMRYPWGIPNEALNNYRKYENPVIVGFHNIMTIVCVNPIVVIVVNGDMEYRTKILSFDPPRQYEKTNKCSMYISLDRGFACGTRMPYDPNPRWFSTDLDITPKLVEKLSDTEGIIPVPWGNLILKKEGDEWAVYAERK